MDYNITLTANHQSLTAKYLPLAAESVQYLTAKVVYETDDWTGREIKAMFGRGCTVYEVPVTGGEITAKQQLNLTAGDWRVWLVGNSARDGDVIPRITTNVAHIRVAPTGGTEGSPFPAIPPTVEEQLRADMGNLADLTTEDKSSLVAAINEAAESGGAADAVTYTPQTLTEEQRAQARTNIGAYTKPASGIPKSDLADDVQTSLAKADTALQSQTIPDWNQNDETAPDYVKNRPFYTGDPVETVLVEESTVSFPENSGLYIAEFPSTFEATVGETYKVYWDGAAYECTCVLIENLPAIGNPSIMGPGSDTGEPFLMGVKNGRRIIIMTADTSASHTISISGLVSEVVKIDEKYLPDNLATKSDVEAAQTTAENAQTTAENSQITASNAQTMAENAKSEALDLAARMFGYTSVVDNAFKYDKTLSITSLPACITSIGSYAFSGCTNLALTSLPSGVTEIGIGAFNSCTQLALTSLPDGLTTIETNAFTNCTNLALTSLPNGLTSIKGGAFRGCTQLALTSLPDGLTEIVGSAFYGCGQLALTSLPNRLTEIDTYTFYYCTNLALTSLPSGLTIIRGYAFYGCTGLTSITFEGKPNSIANNAFNNCTNLTTINVPWAEGEVANAPWGATNATINYNYTEA